MEQEKNTRKSKLWSLLTNMPDIILKITPAIATFVVGYIAADYQSKSSGANLLNQREQAETQLRASMFNNLVTPLIGGNSGRELTASEERLLVELLTLNFHEHVEFKPLLIYVDQKLYGKKRNAQTVEEANSYRKMRKSLKSIVRRVMDRQLAILQKECNKSTDPLCTDNSHFSKNDCLDIRTVKDANRKLQGNPQCIQFEYSDVKSDTAFHDVYAPDGKYHLEISVNDANWEEWEFELNFRIFIKEHNSANFKDLPIDTPTFSITPYDLPFTDNSILDENHRFAVFIKGVENAPKEDPELWLLDLLVVWFPPGYILPHERPFNYQEIRKVLKLDEP